MTLKQLAKLSPYYRYQVKAALTKLEPLFTTPLHENVKGTVIIWSDFKSPQLFCTQDAYIDCSNFKYDKYCREVEPVFFALIINDN